MRKQKKPASAGLCLVAERKGFEPLERKAFNGFRDRPDRPLRHLSETGKKESDNCRLAETEGFEPPKPFGLTVFKTAAIDHSAISPLQKYKKSSSRDTLLAKFCYFCAPILNENEKTTFLIPSFPAAVHGRGAGEDVETLSVDHGV